MKESKVLYSIGVALIVIGTMFAVSNTTLIHRNGLQYYQISHTYPEFFIFFTDPYNRFGLLCIFLGIFLTSIWQKKGNRKK